MGDRSTQKNAYHMTHSGMQIATVSVDYPSNAPCPAIGSISLYLVSIGKGGWKISAVACDTRAYHHIIALFILYVFL
jgi:hypothetical protein